MVNDEQIAVQLNRIKEITKSDILAFALLEAGTRKLSWRHLIGTESLRTSKIKQSATAGLTAQALRTGKAQQLSIAKEEERFCLGEAIMMTENLSHIYIWPIMYHDFRYRGVIIVGRKKEQFHKHSIEQASKYILELEKQFNTSSLLI